MKRTPLKRGKPLKRSRMKKKPPPQGFPQDVRLAVRRRSKERCETESVVCTGAAEHFHHRKLRRHKDHSAINCLHVCRACHFYIHDQMGNAAYLMGWLVHSWDDPASIPARKGGGG